MDTKDKLPPIPTPASQRWREFRIQVLPFVMFFAIVVAIVLLWKSYVQPIGVIGFAETNQVNITSLSDGIIDHLYVESFQSVTQGQLIATVSGAGSDVIRAQIAAAQADLEVIRDRYNIDRDRVIQNIYDAQQKLLEHEIAQATSRQDWYLRSNDFRRATEEFTKKIMSEADYEKFKTTFEVIGTHITQTDAALKLMRGDLEKMREQSSRNEAKSIDEAIRAKQAELEVTLKPSDLRSPIDGMVSVVHLRQGERILRGSSIATIVDPQARRVIGYVRQPVTLLPTTNDTVKIIKRTAPSVIGLGRIERVGAQFEIINPALLSTDTKRMEVGLPVLVSVPANLRLVPGEYVTLTIEYAPNP